MNRQHPHLRHLLETGRTEIISDLACPLFLPREERWPQQLSALVQGYMVSQWQD